MAKKTLLQAKAVKKAAPKKSIKAAATKTVTAAAFIKEMKKHQSDEELEKIQRYFKSGEGEYSEGDKFMGIRMGTLFGIAKEFIDMEPTELEKLLESDIHEVRTGALSIMDKQGRNNKTNEQRRKELYDLYMRRHDRINNWDLVDIAAIYVVGRYLNDKPKNVLYKLAKSKNMWQRRTAIVSTAYFLKSRRQDDTYQIAEMLLHDKEDLLHKAAGGWIRQAGVSDRPRLLAFLDRHAATMPRTFLRYAIEHLNPTQKKYYMDMKSN